MIEELRSTPVDLAAVVDRLVLDGAIADEAAARNRLSLGYPPWLVLQELSPERVITELSLASGVPVCQRQLDLADVDRSACRAAGPDSLLEQRWLPMTDGGVAIANPCRPFPDGDLAGRPLSLVSSSQVDRLLEQAFPNSGAAIRNRRRLGRYLLDAGAVTEETLARALDEQRRNGGRLGQVLISNGMVEPGALTLAIAARLEMRSLPGGAVPVPVLPRAIAHELRAVALQSGGLTDMSTAVNVAFVDPTDESVEQVAALLGRPVDPHVTDDETLDALLASLYARDDVVAVVDELHAEAPHMSAFSTRFSRAQSGIAIGLVLLVALGLVIDAKQTAIWLVAIGTSIYVLYSFYRLYSAWKGWRLGSILDPTPEQLASLDGRELPSYTVLLPVFREKPQTLRPLFAALSAMDYPKQKLNGLLLVEADDTQTQEAMAAVEAAGDGVRPPWLKTLLIPPGEPRTKPKAMIYALLYSVGELLTIFDAEDKPDPDQLKKAAWAFQQVPENVACIQAKLSYYNSRQNLLTRWFTLEYAAWFDLFLPGLHAMDAPIPLGGTSNHFRLDILKEVMSWDPYNVTEDADLGLRFTRAGYRTRMLESTTYEEANSKYRNWVRQRSRWIKGYMQTFLVHTRNPVSLYRELGLVNTAHFLATVGGLIYTVVVSPLFWSLLVVWLALRPGWIPELFPGPIYYMAMGSLVIGNFFFVFLALIGAVGRGQDDLSPYTLLFPIYWMMMSVAAYMALYELIRKPHYWQKTEHGLHVVDELDGSGGTTPAAPAVGRPLPPIEEEERESA